MKKAEILKEIHKSEKNIIEKIHDSEKSIIEKNHDSEKALLHGGGITLDLNELVERLERYKGVIASLRNQAVPFLPGRKVFEVYQRFDEKYDIKTYTAHGVGKFIDGDYIIDDRGERHYINTFYDDKIFFDIELALKKVKELNGCSVDELIVKEDHHEST